MVGRLAWALAAGVALVLALAFALSRARYSAFLGGLWVGDPGFLAKAGLSDFQLYVGPAERGGRAAYLLAADGAGELVANGAFRLRPGRASPGPALRAALAPAGDAFVFPRAAFEGAPLLPPTLRLTLSLLEGTLTLDDGKKVYAFLGRDPAASAAAAEAWRIGAPPPLPS